MFYKKLIISILLSLIFNNFVNSKEIFIVSKVNDEIITNIDVGLSNATIFSTNEPFFNYNHLNNTALYLKVKFLGQMASFDRLNKNYDTYEKKAKETMIM